MFDACDGRRVTLVYAARDWESVTFREELTELEDFLDLHVEFVFRPRRVDSELLVAAAARLRAPFNVYVCGPPRVVGSALFSLNRVSFPSSWLHTEECFNV